MILRHSRLAIWSMAGLLAIALLLVPPVGHGPGRAHAQAKPEGEMRWALYVTLSPAWFDPGEVVGVITPFWVLTAMHDALVKPMPGGMLTPSLAESWKVSPDHRVYEFKLREGLKFHNGDPFTAEDVKFSFLRAKGARILQEKVKDIEIAGPYRVRFHLREPWPDFMTFYGTYATSAGWIAPKKYMERVGPDGFKKNPVGLGPYKFVSHTPGVELVMEANESYWRKMPSVKRLVYKSVPEATTRVAMLKRGEVDLAYLLDAPQALELKRDPNFKLAFSGGIGTFYLDFLDQADPKSPWHDRRVRLAASHAMDRKALSEAETLGASRPTGSMIPPKFEFALPLEPHPYDPARAKQLLAEAGYPNGFDAGDLYPWPPYTTMGEAVGGVPGRGGDQGAPADDGAGRLLLDAGLEEDPRALRVHQRGLRQRGLPDGRDGAERRRLLLRGRGRHRRALQAAEPGDRPPQAGGPAAPDPADAPRAGPLRADHGLHLAERGERAGGRARPDADRSLPVVGASRGRAPQEVTGPVGADRRSPSAASRALVASSLTERSRMMATARVGLVRTR